MTTCTKCLAQRRSFIAKAVGLIGAAYSVVGFAPPAFAQALTLPDPSPLDGAIAAKLYAEATQDPVAYQLIQQVGGPVRLDPPVQAVRQRWSNGVVFELVVMPLTSYATGAPRGYMYFGNSIFGGEVDGVRLTVRDDGAVITVRGDETASNRNLSTALFATWFPDIFSDHRDESELLIRRPTSFIPEDEDVRLAQAAPPGTHELCAQKFRECLLGTVGACLGATIAAVACAGTVKVCFDATGGFAFLTTKCIATLGVCAFAVQAVTNCISNIYICNNRAGECDATINPHPKPEKLQPHPLPVRVAT